MSAIDAKSRAEEWLRRNLVRIAAGAHEHAAASLARLLDDWRDLGRDEERGDAVLWLVKMGDRQTAEDIARGKHLPKTPLVNEPATAPQTGDGT